MVSTKAMRCLACAIAMVLPATAQAEDHRPAISLIIDDLGNHRVNGERTLALPGPVACAFLPHAPFSRSQARRAHALDKEVLLHLPMQAMRGEHAHQQPGELTLDMTEQQFAAVFSAGLDSVPHVTGLNNHRGSLLTRHPGHMGWLMQSVNARGNLFFVDSRTTGNTVARRLANEHGIPSTSRNVFLDNLADPASIRSRFRELVRQAHAKGTALGIGHPFSATLDVLQVELASLEENGVRLLPVAELIELQNGRKSSWRASLSR